MVVVANLQGNGFMELRYVLELVQRTRLGLEVARPALHVAVLPGTKAVPGRTLYFIAFTNLLVLFFLSPGTPPHALDKDGLRRYHLSMKEIFIH